MVSHLKTFLVKIHILENGNIPLQYGIIEKLPTYKKTVKYNGDREPTNAKRFTNHLKVLSSLEMYPT